MTTEIQPVTPVGNDTVTEAWNGWKAPSLPDIKKPVAMNPPLADWPEAYKTRRTQLKRGIVKLTSGRSIAYTDDCAHLLASGRRYTGDTQEIAYTAKVVICLHGMCQSKALWLLPKPLEGVRQIAIDRFGYGDSSGDGAGHVKDDWLKAPSAHLLMDEQSLDYVEFVDKMGIDKCYLIGHSAGSIFGQALAMRLDKQQRLLGVALMGTMPHPRHNKLKDDATWWAAPHGPPGTKKTIKKSAAMSQGMQKRGCCCCSMWHLVNMMSAGMVYKNRETKDPGFADLYKTMMRNPKEDGGSEAVNAEMDKDPFMVAASLEAYLYGQKYSEVMMCDMFRFFGSTWGDLDDGTIDAPMLVYNGEHDNAMPAHLLDFFPKVYPQAKTTVLKGHGHSTMFLELERIMQELTQL